jgi:hypothetical protein
MHEWWWFNRYESVNYPVYHNRLGSQTALLECVPTQVVQHCCNTVLHHLCSTATEYACSVWAPHTQSNTNKLESVQRRAARFATGNYNTTSSVTTMLNHLSWWISFLKDSRSNAAAVASGSWFHNRIVDGKKDSLCTVVLLYGTICLGTSYPE